MIGGKLIESAGFVQGPSKIHRITVRLRVFLKAC